MNVVITGAGRGIGLELCRAALVRGDRVFGISRQPQKSEGLQNLLQEFADRLQVVALDVTAVDAGEKILSGLKDWKSIDVLINNAGILDESMSPQSLMHSFQVNSIAPLLITQSLLPKLKLSSNAVVAQITSRMGSIADANSGGYYGYRSSKTALNMFNKCLAMDNPWLTALVIHPGWVKTEMGGASAPIEPKDSAAGIWKVIQEAKTSKKSGHFQDYKGNPIPW
jgi:NAD(P)-dependent dehydrogenase (short-subunit alcohol dehydrogenase family)